MISTAITLNRGIALDASRDAAGCRVRTAASVVSPAIHDAQHRSQDTSVDYRIMAELRASSFEGQVWFVPAAFDALVPTTTGHPAWSPPT